MEETYQAEPQSIGPPHAFFGARVMQPYGCWLGQELQLFVMPHELVDKTPT